MCLKAQNTGDRPYSGMGYKINCTNCTFEYNAKQYLNSSLPFGQVVSLPPQPLLGLSHNTLQVGEQCCMMTLITAARETTWTGSSQFFFFWAILSLFFIDLVDQYHP